MPSTPGNSTAGARATVRAVIDTNVLLDLWVFGDTRAMPLLAALESGEIAAVTSRPCNDELAEVLERAELGLGDDERRAILACWHRLATLLEPGDAAPLDCSDPDDQKFLDLAYAAQADWLFTRDNALLELAPGVSACGLRIAQPSDFARVVGR
jgi:uncharacterized protein